MSIPILIICHNNYKYVENTIRQIGAANSAYLNDIIVVDNASSEESTVSYLSNLTHKIIRNENNGPWICGWCNTHIYSLMPDQFVLTDPDLEFNYKLPPDFIQRLSVLSNKYKCHKIGFALDIRDSDKMYDGVYAEDKTISQWESQFWTTQIEDPDYTLYKATIDTTFCLVNKSYVNDFNIRVADKFTAKHLPWYKESTLFNVYDTYVTYSNQSKHISSIAKHALSYVESKYTKVEKCGETFFIETRSSDPNLRFWTDIYHQWEPETFAIFDRFLSKDKYAIDIGGWIGSTCMYSARKSKGVFVVEADRHSFVDLQRNCLNNCENVVCVEKAIYSESDIDVVFGKNKYRDGATLNDSTSQIHGLAAACTDGERDDAYRVKTVAIADLFKQHKIDPITVSLIKVDIEGGEEHILDQLYAVHIEFGTPLYVSFHHTWWTNKNLDRFAWLTDAQKQRLHGHPFTSLLFERVQQLP
jgi:FkbM family methyltransferase